MTFQQVWHYGKLLLNLSEIKTNLLEIVNLLDHHRDKFIKYEVRLWELNC